MSCTLLSTRLMPQPTRPIAARQATALNAWCFVIHSPTHHQRLSSIGRQVRSSPSCAVTPTLSFGGKSSRPAGMSVTRITKLQTTPTAEKMPNILMGTSSLTASVARPMAVVPVASVSGTRAWCTARPAAPSRTPVSAIWSR